MGGDCTASYDVELDKPYTVAEFINEVLTTRKNEWGSINVKDAFYLKYRYGKTEQEIPEQYANLSVKKVKAAGGYTAMSYDVDVEFKEEVENKINQGLFDIKTSEPLDPIWEQRRYEIAKALFSANIAGEYKRLSDLIEKYEMHTKAKEMFEVRMEDLAKSSVQYADMLIKQLKGEK